MGIVDKAKNEAEKLIGQGKETAGKHTDNPDLEAEGKSDQTKASAKKVGEDVKDAGSDIKKKLS